MKILTPEPNHSISQLLKIIAEQEKQINLLKEENTTLKKNCISFMSEGKEEIFYLKEFLEYIMPGNIFWKDKDGRCIGCNNNLAKFFGCQSPEELIGKYNSQFMPDEFAKKLDATDKEILHTKQGQYLEETTIDTNGNLAYFYTHKIPLLNKQGEAVGIFGISLDITKQKMLEEELKTAKEKAEISNQTKSQFLATVNHEIRTPLSSILGLLSFLKQGHLPASEEKIIINSIESCANHLLNLVNDVLDFSRLESGKYNVQMHPVDLAKLSNEVYSIVKVLAEKKNLKFEIDVDANIPQIIFTDPRILKQILINLTGNAIKFTEYGNVTLQIKKLQQKNEKKVLLELAVIDTGLGIPDDKLEFIFQAFNQIEDAYARQTSRAGTGLGLTIVDKLVGLINAQVHVTSKLGKGSVFSVIGEFETRDSSALIKEIDKNISKPNPQIDEDENTVKAIYPGLISYQPKVLLIEDDAIIQFIHKKMLQSLGCHVDIVATGSEAMQIIQQPKIPYDIAFVDISLPDVNGFELIKSFRERKDLPHIPLIALTAYTSAEEKIACFRAGADEFNSKPISVAQFKRMILQYLPFLECKEQANA